MVDVDQLVDHLADVIHGRVRALVGTADGRPLASSAGLSPAQAAELATYAAAITGLTAGAADVLATTDVRRTTVDMANGALVVTTLPDGTILTVLTVFE